MCGIFGSIGIALCDVNLDKIFKSLRERGPDDQGHSFYEAEGLLLGHTRLSIHDLSPMGHQPMMSSTGRFEIAFNGEIYNYQALAARLTLLGYSFKGNSDTEVMLACFEEYGVREALRIFDGMFAFSLVDRFTKKIYLCRDRIGEKPLYYFQRGPKIVWSSNLKAMSGFRGVELKISRVSIAKLLRYGYIPGPSSIYEEVFKLEPASMLSIDLNRSCPTLNIERYWDLEAVVNSEPLSFDSDEEAIYMLDRLLQNSISRQMQADVPLGAFLSGGVDSSLVAAIMQELSSQKVNTFSIGFEDESYNEAPHAEGVAKHIGTNHTEYIVSPNDVLSVVPRIHTIYDEPFADSSQIPTYLLCGMAKSDVTVALSGDGGDELFQGYRRYSLTEERYRRFGTVGSRLMGSILSSIPDSLADVGLRICRGRLSRRQFKAYLEMAKHSERNKFYHTCISANLNVASIVKGIREEDSMNEAFNVFNTSFPRDYSLSDMITYLPDDILVKVDRASMAFSLEARVPLLDREVLEFALRTPMKYKTRGGDSKWILKQVLYKYVPKSLVNRPKMGFGVPLGDWLRSGLRDWAHSLLSSASVKSENFFHVNAISQLWAEHQRGYDRSAQLWPILMASAWMENERSL